MGNNYEATELETRNTIFFTKLTAFVIGFILLHTACELNPRTSKEDSTHFYVEGIIRDRADTTVYLTTKPISDHIDPDTIAIGKMKDGFFSIEGHIDGPIVAELTLEGSPKKNEFVLENTSQYLEVYWRESFVYSGGKYHNKVLNLKSLDLNYFRMSTRILGYNYDKYAKYLEYKKLGHQDSIRILYNRSAVKKAKNLVIQAKRKRNKILDSLINGDIDPIYKALLLTSNNKKGSSYVWKYRDVADQTIEDLKSLGRSKDLLKSLESMMNERIAFYQNEKTLKKGNYFKPVTLKDQMGIDVSLAEATKQNKYVFIDFWASWCGPCIAEFPYIKKAYKKYKSKGFEVYAISIDENHKEWIKSVNEKNTGWINTIVPKEKINEIKGKYNVEFLPYNFLIDTNGKIVARNLRRDALMEKLAELL